MWYLLYHHERKFSRIVRELTRLNIPYVSPQIARYAPRTDRAGYRALSPIQLFPCYIFVELDIEIHHTSKITALDGAICFVGFGGKQYSISPGVIDDIVNLSSKATYVNDIIYVSGVALSKENDISIVDIITESDSVKRLKKLNDWLALPKHNFQKSA